MARKISWLILLFIIAGCYPLKKAEKQTDKAYEHYPAMVAGKTRVWFPCNTIDSTVTFDTTKVNDSSAYFRAKADSLLKVKQRIVTENEIIYKDTCTSIKDEYQSGFDLGYETGYYYGKTETKKDTILKIINKSFEDSSKIFLAQIIAKECQQNSLKLDKKIYAKNRLLWAAAIFALLGWLLAALFLYLLGKRR